MGPVGPNKNLTISYNHLNLPTKFSFSAQKYIDILYDATGQKLKKTVTSINGTVTTTTTQDYNSGIELKDGKIESIYNEEGRLGCKHSNRGKNALHHNLQAILQRECHFEQRWYVPLEVDD